MRDPIAQTAKPILLALAFAFSAAAPAQEIAALPDELPDDPFNPLYRLNAVRERFETGRYDDVARLAEKAVKLGWGSAAWRTLQADALFRLGRYGEAAGAAEALAEFHGGDLSALMLGHEVLRRTGHAEEAKAVLAYVDELLKRAPKEQDSYPAPQLIGLGKAALAMGADPQKALDMFLKPALQKDAGLLDAHLAVADLAMAIEDYTLASKYLLAAAKRFPESAEVTGRLAEAFFTGDREAAMGYAEQALARNPNDARSRLIMADHWIDAEDYEKADEALEPALKFNPRHPGALARRAALRHLSNDMEGYLAARRKALEPWPDNPEIDHVIGKALSRHRRFEEAAEHQRRALERDPTFTAAKVYLAQDLLRIGQDEEGWRLAKEVQEQDGYNVIAFNLATLHDHIAEFKVIRTPDFTLRMDAREAGVYADQALALLTDAKRVLGEKYGLELDRPVLVEFFPSQQDFAIRTLGVPGGAGILGACFGSLVTMNSPGGAGAQGNNWEATLWHEFCHVITLTATKNRMPRWLSEGISVYEELQRDDRWGQRMTPRYREMILEEDALFPLEKLGYAFLNPKDGEALMFAYYQACLAIEYFVQNFGEEKLRAVLRDLAEGKDLNDSMARRFAPLAKLESGFKAFADKRAKDFAPKADFDPPETPLAGAEAFRDFLADHPNNIPALTAAAAAAVEAGDGEAAKRYAEKIIKLWPEQRDDGSGYLLLARAERLLGDADAERAALEKLASLSADTAPAFQRLAEMALDAGDWEAAAANAERLLAVNPMLAAPHRALGVALQNLGKSDEAAAALARHLNLDPANPADAQFRLAQLKQTSDPAAAKRHLLQALEDAPRFRAAHRLLLEMTAADQAPPTPAPASASDSPEPPTPGPKPEPDTESKPATPGGAEP